jgi:hypothetical protein
MLPMKKLDTSYKDKNDLENTTQKRKDNGKLARHG